MSFYALHSTDPKESAYGCPKKIGCAELNLFLWTLCDVIFNISNCVVRDDCELVILRIGLLCL